MLTVHHLGVSQSLRIVWLCEELEIPYALKVYKRAESGLAPPEYKALHPAGTAPIITDGDVVLPESGAIIEYIIARHGDGRIAVPPSAPNFADYLFWLHFANGSFLPSSIAVMFSGENDGPESKFGQVMRARNERAWRLVEERLGQAPYFAGDALTGADIMMLFPVGTPPGFGARDLSPYPNTRAYIQRIGDRPAYRRALEKAF